MGYQFRMPDVGEGLTEAEIVSWRVKVGDTVEVNAPIVEIETAKSLVELPCPVAGVVARLMAAEGDTVPVGQPIISIDSAEGDGDTGDAGDAGADGEKPEPLLVGYGPSSSRSRRRRAVPEPPAPEVATPEPAAPEPVAPEPVVLQPSSRPLAKPPVRKLARDLGVDLAAVTPSGPGGVITRDDVTAVGQSVPAGRPEQGRETRTPVRGVRKATAEAMVASAFTAPHVTTWVSVDVTRSLRLLRRSRSEPAATPLLLIARALLLAVRKHPQINASWDGDAIVTKHYVNLGIAAATPRGLLVPVIADADRLSSAELAAELSRVVGVARDGTASPGDLGGGTITITNIGVFGVDGGTPILPPGQAAILGVGRIARRPWVHKGRVRPRDVVELTLSFDHRLVDGDLGSRFLADIAAVLERPGLALL